MEDPSDKIKKIAFDTGFDLVGVARIQQYPEMSSFLAWVEAGYAADMTYLIEKTSPRLNPGKILPGAKSVISCGLLYNTKRDISIDKKDRDRGWISRYAWGKDYHYVVEKMLDELIERMQAELSISFNSRRYVDTGPVLERMFAYHAGLGWFGKNSCLIHPKLGSYFFLGEILTDLDIESDEEIPDHCGTCTRCIDACPTHAIVGDGVVDSNKCISYHTIENRGEIPNDFRADMGNHVFGCDICQEVCPWNNKSPLSNHPDFEPRGDMFHPTLSSLAKRIIHQYPQAFPKSPLKRPKQHGLLRNLFIAFGNSGNPDFLPLLEHKKGNDDEMPEETRLWAIKQLEKKEIPKTAD